MSSETMNWEAIARYLAGESPAEEQAAVQRWLASKPGDARMLAALDDALDRVALGPDAEQGIDVEAALAAVKARRDEPGLRVVRGNAPRLQMAPRRSFAWMPMAAAAAVIIAVGALVLRKDTTQSPAIPTTIAARTLTTPAGGRDSILLPDGSQVILGPGSALTIAEGFGQTERRVTLRGEALFTVVHDAAKPFVVAGNGTEIRDIGTAFAVHSDAGGVRVAVTDGVVELTRTGATAAPTTLKAGDLATVTPAGRITAERGVNTDDELAWTRGKLVFRDAPLEEVSEDLVRWYGVHLSIQDPALRRLPIKATFEGDSIQQVLNVIRLMSGTSMERRGDTVFLRPVPR